MQQKVALEATEEGFKEPHDDQGLKKHKHEQAVTEKDKHSCHLEGQASSCKKVIRMHMKLLIKGLCSSMRIRNRKQKNATNGKEHQPAAIRQDSHHPGKANFLHDKQQPV